MATSVATALLRAEIPTDTSPKTPPSEVTNGLMQIGGWFYWFAVGTLSVFGVAAGVYLAVSFRRTGKLSEGECRVAYVALGALLTGTSGGWAGVVL